VVVVSDDCPYCGRSFSDPCYLYRHAMTEHRDAVLAYWVEEHDVSPMLSGQQRLQEAVV
jgi:hypothetical protein